MRIVKGVEINGPETPCHADCHIGFQILTMAGGSVKWSRYLAQRVRGRGKSSSALALRFIPFMEVRRRLVVWCLWNCLKDRLILRDSDNSLQAKREQWLGVKLLKEKRLNRHGVVERNGSRHRLISAAKLQRRIQIESERQESRPDLYVPDVADSDDELKYLGTQVVESSGSKKASPITSGTGSDDDILPPLTTLLNNQPRPVASTAPPPHVIVPSSYNYPPPATAPGQASRARKQTGNKES